jgi:hypothetical protein
MLCLWLYCNKETIVNFEPKYNCQYPVFQLDFEIFRTIASFIKISSGQFEKYVGKYRETGA